METRYKRPESLGDGTLFNLESIPAGMVVKAASHDLLGLVQQRILDSTDYLLVELLREEINGTIDVRLRRASAYQGQYLDSVPRTLPLEHHIGEIYFPEVRVATDVGNNTINFSVLDRAIDIDYEGGLAKKIVTLRSRQLCDIFESTAGALDNTQGADKERIDLRQGRLRIHLTASLYAKPAEVAGTAR